MTSTSVSRIVGHISLVIVVSVVAMRGSVAPTPGSENLPILFEHASIVCKGQVISIRDAGETTVQISWRNVRVNRHIATIAIDRTYKPTTLPSTIEVQFDTAATPTDVAFAAVKTGEYALLILNTVGGTNVFLNPWFYKFPVSRALATSCSGASGIETLECDLVQGLTDTDDARVMTNLELLGALGHISNLTRGQLLSLADRPDLAIQSMATLALLKDGDYSRLRQALQFISQTGLSSELAMIQGRTAGAIDKIHDSVTVPILLAYSGSPQVLVRTNVVRALRNLADPRSVPALVKRLDDPDFSIRYDAVYTLATIDGKLNSEWISAVDGYRLHEASYIARWKAWWQSEGQFKYGTS